MTESIKSEQHARKKTTIWSLDLDRRLESFGLDGHSAIPFIGLLKAGAVILGNPHVFSTASLQERAPPYEALPLGQPRKPTLSFVSGRLASSKCTSLHHAATFSCSKRPRHIEMDP